MINLGTMTFRCTAALLLATTALSAFAQQSAAVEKLMQQSDRYRGGLSKGITWNINIDSVEDEEKTSQSYLVRAKDVNAVCECQAPARCKGEVVLFNDRNLWFIKPGVRKPVAISARQRLSGQAANGDIASTNYARDYEATYVKVENVKGEDAYLLDLKAKAKNVTYDRIRYWVSKKRRLALKADFLTVSGDTFKSATFEYNNTIPVDGKAIPFVSKMTIVDAAFPTNITTITYQNPREEAHSESIFNINNIIR